MDVGEGSEMMAVANPGVASSLQRLRMAMATSDYVPDSPLGLLLYDAEGTIVECNDAAAAFFQLELSELIGHSIRANQNIRLQYRDGTTMPPDQVPLVVSLRERRNLVGELCGMDVQGKPLRWIRVNTQLVEHDGALEGAIVTWLDCTAEIEHEHILELGSDVLSMAARHDEPTQILQSLCDVLVHDGRYPLAWIATDLRDGEGTVEVSHAAGEVDYLYDGIASTLATEPNGIGLVGTAFRTGRVQVSNDMADKPEFEFFRARATEFGFWSTVAIPFSTSQPHVLAVYDRHVHAFDDALVSGIQEMTETVARRAQLLTSLKEARRSLDGTIGALGRATEARDPYTAGHQFRVGELGEAIARDLSLDPELATQIRLAGEVHDVGKIAIPAEILTRPGRLSELEFAYVKQHCEIGAEIIEKASLPSIISDVALHHHERLDGSGYPFGLRGEQISIAARIIAVADVVEAMMNHRPYRAALGIEAALAEIQRGRGTLFDPRAVDACVALFASGFGF